MTKEIYDRVFNLDKDVSYANLLQAFPPKVIRSEDDRAEMQQAIDALIDRGSGLYGRAEDLSQDERNFLDLLGVLMEVWEEKSLAGVFD